MFKKVKTNFILIKWQKVGKFSFIFNLFTFQSWENIKAKFPLVIVKNSAISHNWSTLSTIKILVYFFRSEEVYFIINLNVINMQGILLMIRNVKFII